MRDEVIAVSCSSGIRQFSCARRHRSFGNAPDKPDTRIHRPSGPSGRRCVNRSAWWVFRAMLLLCALGLANFLCRFLKTRWSHGVSTHDIVGEFVCCRSVSILRDVASATQDSLGWARLLLEFIRLTSDLYAAMAACASQRKALSTVRSLVVIDGK